MFYLKIVLFYLIGWCTISCHLSYDEKIFPPAVPLTTFCKNQVFDLPLHGNKFREKNMLIPMKRVVTFSRGKDSEIVSLDGYLSCEYLCIPNVTEKVAFSFNCPTIRKTFILQDDIGNSYTFKITFFLHSFKTYLLKSDPNTLNFKYQVIIIVYYDEIKMKDSNGFIKLVSPQKKDIQDISFSSYASCNISGKK